MEKTKVENGIHYTLVGDYYLPDLALPDEPQHHIGIWGQRRLDYLKNHRKGFYTSLLTQCKLNSHLHEIDIAATERHETIVRQMMAARGVSEQLKANDMMKWVGMVNNIRDCVDEIVLSELIYA